MMILNKLEEESSEAKKRIIKIYLNERKKHEHLNAPHFKFSDTAKRTKIFGKTL
jgi:hypothetical protein